MYEITIHQLFAVLVNEYELQFPYIVKLVSDSFNFVSFNVFSFITFGCRAATIDQYGKLMLVTIVPTSLLALLFTTTLLLRLECLTRRVMTSSTRSHWRSLLQTIAMAIMFLVLPTVSSEIVRSVRCTSFDDGSSYLTADFTIDCASARYTTMVRYAAVMFVLFPVGIPTFVFVMLLRQLHVVYPRNQNRLLQVSG